MARCSYFADYYSASSRSRVDREQVWVVDHTHSQYTSGKNPTSLATKLSIVWSLVSSFLIEFPVRMNGQLKPLR